LKGDNLWMMDKVTNMLRE